MLERRFKLATFVPGFNSIEHSRLKYLFLIMAKSCHGVLSAYFLLRYANMKMPMILSQGSSWGIPQGPGDGLAVVKPFSGTEPSACMDACVCAC
jgi:hypothetical protein